MNRTNQVTLGRIYQLVDLALIKLSQREGPPQAPWRRTLCNQGVQAPPVNSHDQGRLAPIELVNDGSLEAALAAQAQVRVRLHLQACMMR